MKQLLYIFKKQKNLILAIGCSFICIFFCSNVLAYTKPLANSISANNNINTFYWDGSNASIAYQSNTGNTSATTLQSNISAVYTRIHWNNTAEFKSNYGTSAKGVLNEERYSISNQSDLNLNPKSRLPQFIFLNGSYKIDNFGPYYDTTNVAGGYGVTAIKNDRVIVSLQSGPGYQYSVSRNGHDVYLSSATIDFKINSKLFMFNKKCALTEGLLYRISKQYNYVNSVTSFVNKITDHFAFSLNYEINYYSSIPENSENQKRLDTTTSASLVYSL